MRQCGTFTDRMDRPTGAWGASEWAVIAPFPVVARRVLARGLSAGSLRRGASEGQTCPDTGPGRGHEGLFRSANTASTERRASGRRLPFLSLSEPFIARDAAFRRPRIVPST